MTQQLPWDRFPTEEPVPEPPLPPVPAPVPTPPVKPIDDRVIPPDVGGAARDALDAALQDFWPWIKDRAIGYGKDSVREIMAGHTVDLAHPTITTTDMTGRELVVADAKSRSWRTLVQGLIFDVFAGIVAAVAILSGADPFARQTWAAFGILLLKSVVSAVISYFMRLKVTPTLKTEGTKYAIAPVPRPMIDNEERRSA